MKLKVVYITISEAFERLDKKYPDQIPYIYAITSSLFMALGSLVVKYCKEIPAYEIVYFRSILLIILSTRLMNLSGENVYCENKKAFKFLLLRAFFSATSTLFFFTANQMINLGESSILFLTSPIWSNFISYFFFNEGFSLSNLFFTLVSFVSIVVLLNPPFLKGESQEESVYDSNQLIGQLFSLGGAVSYAINSNLNKYLKGHVSKQQLVFYLCSSALICSSILKIYQAYSSMEVYSLFYMGCIAIFSLLQFLLQIFINQALFMKGANKILPFNYFQVLFSLIFDYLLFGKSIGFIQSLSSIVIIFCCYKIATNK